MTYAQPLKDCLARPEHARVAKALRPPQRRRRIPLQLLFGPLAIATIALALSTPAWAAEGEVVQRTVRVGYADLDLADPGGRAVLERRIGRAVNRICFDRTQLDLTLRARMARTCRAEAIAGVQPQLALLYRRGSLTQASLDLRSAAAP
jgi:UrcA family protein